MHHTLIELLTFFFTLTGAPLPVPVLAPRASRPCGLLIAACALALISFFTWHRSS
jgi:hypothetical protein